MFLQLLSKRLHLALALLACLGLAGCAHPSDELVLEAAVNASADYLVTHNLRDFATAGGFAVQVVTPGQFLKLLDGGAP